MDTRKPTRREFIRIAGAGLTAAALPFTASGCLRNPGKKPNVVYILADDLGIGELGCYGQTKIWTPNIDRLAAEGMRFTRHYAGSPVCAPSRCTLLTGKHTGHAFIRDNDELSERGDVWHDPDLEGQRPVPAGTFTLGTLMKQAGYATACIGKWGLGGPDSEGHPNRQGFDHFFGYLCQRVAHNYYPTHLWRNKEKVILEGNSYFFPHQRLDPGADPDDPRTYDPYKGKTYAPDRMAEEALQFIRDHRKEPFFLLYTTLVPHLALQVPDDSLEAYADAFPETPYRGDRGYLPHPTPRAAYAAMISRLDRDVGRIVDLLRALDLEEDTLILVTSDNGPTYTGGADTAYFESAGGLKGLKGSLDEGGIRVPLIARWPGQIPAGKVCDHVSAFYDVMPTLADLTDQAVPEEIDGLSFLRALKGQSGQPIHDYLYWEFPGYGGQQAVQRGKWKGIRRHMHQGLLKIELYDLETDPGESRDVAPEYPEIVDTILRIMKEARTPSAYFPFKALDGEVSDG